LKQQETTPTIRRDIVALVVFAFIARLVWHMVAGGADWPDTAVYVSAGRSLFATGSIDSVVMMPLYPILITVFGPDGILWLQIALSSLTVALIYALSLELFASRPAALVAGVIACFYPSLIFYANMRLTETSYIFLTLAGFLACYRGRFFLGSVALVLSVLIRPSMEIVLPLIVIAFSLARGEWELRTILRRVGVYAIVYLVLMSPWWWHNWLLYGAFVRLNLGDATVWILENNELFDRVGLDFTALAPAWEKFFSITDPIARHAAMKAEAFTYIKDRPLHWLWRCADRFMRFWNPVPGSNSLAINIISLASTVPVYLAAVAGFMMLGRRGLMRVLPALLFIGALTALHSLVHAVPRYRLPLEPFLMIVAAYAVAHVVASPSIPERKPQASSPA
jgi:4-amino-4-deoxy-L-arabinose transferase-like glycosyltransferase